MTQVMEAQAHNSNVCLNSQLCPRIMSSPIRTPGIIKATTQIATLNPSCTCLGEIIVFFVTGDAMSERTSSNLEAT